MNKIKQHKEKILGLIISLIFIGLIFWNIDFHELLETFKIFNYKVLLIFIPLYVISLYIRGFRWKYLLYNTNNLTVKEAFFAFTTGNTLNSYLPARAGDFWRAYHIGHKIGESKMKLLGSIILERLIDGISVLLILFFAVLTYFKHQWILNIAYIAAALFLGSLIIIFLIFKFNRIDYFFEKLIQVHFLKKFKSVFLKIASVLNRFLDGFQALNSPKNFFAAFFASCFAWGIECVLTYILITGFGHYYGFSIAYFVISFIALSTIIPSSSVFVGPYQFAYILALNIYHIEKSNALGIAFIHQITIMITITIISVIYFMISNTSIKELRTEIDENNNSLSEVKKNDGNTQS